MCAICNFKIEFGVGHPLSLSIAMATRNAIESGLLEELKVEGDGGVLGTARRRLAAIDLLSEFQEKVESAVPASELMALPDFYVLLIESQTWGFFHATPDGFDPDIVPEIPDTTIEDAEKRSNVMLMAETTMQAILSGACDWQRALNDELIVIDAPAGRRELLLSAIAHSLAQPGALAAA